MRRWFCVITGCVLLVAASGLFASAAGAEEASAAGPLLPSEYSELVYVYESLRDAAQSGDVNAYRDMYDPAALYDVYTDTTGQTRRLTRAWLRTHAREWPDVSAWDVAEAVRLNGWARLVFRHPHLENRHPDGRWDFYFLVFRRVGEHWRFTRRAIGTFGTPGPLSSPPQLANIQLLPMLEPPPAAPSTVTTALGE